MGLGLTGEARIRGEEILRGSFFCNLKKIVGFEKR